MGKLVQTAPCRFCGQMIQLEDQEEEYTKEQAEEAATEQCNCGEALEYKKSKKRKKRAIRNVQQLFGEDAEPEKRCSADVVEILKAAVEEIHGGELAKITLNVRGGVKASISQNSKGEIKVERTETKKQELTE